MSAPYTLFTGQWADLTLDEVAELAAGWGYDGLEIAVTGEHLDAWRWDDEDYLAERRAILDKHGLGLWAISNHLTGQAVCDDPIDFRHQAIVRPRVWGDGEPEGVRQRAAEEMQHTARLAKALGVKTVVGFTGSAIWQYVAMFPPVGADRIEAGTKTSPTAGTRSSTSSTSAVCGSRTRCTRPRSPTTTGRRVARSMPSAIARRSASTGTRAT
jgi:sugar phosphate isomerase/epimerase